MRDVQERLWPKVKKTDDCWLWLASLDTNGYGQFPILGMPRKGAHKVVYELLVSKVPDGMELDHLCRNRSCVNPNHLEVVTPLENKRRGIWPNGRGVVKQINCRNGHKMEEPNLYWSKGTRTCKKCRKEKNIAYKRRTRGPLKNK